MHLGMWSRQAAEVQGGRKAYVVEPEMVDGGCVQLWNV